MEKINKILYMGVWYHIKPVVDFPNTKEFIFIDIQPRSPYDNNSFNNDFYKPNFYEDLVKICYSYGFILQDTIELDNSYHNKIFTTEQKLYYSTVQLPKFINPTLLVFMNNKTQQILKYYISTNIKYNMNNMISNDIANADTMIIKGYFPDRKILDYFTKPKIFIGYPYTFNEFDEYNKEDIIYFIHQNKENVISKYFSDFYLFSSGDCKMIKCKDIRDIIELEKLQ